MSAATTRRIDSDHAIHVGFVPLIDAAPLIVASELGYFEAAGLNVRLRKQIGWGNVRDRLTYGELHATHAPLGMIPASIAGLKHYDEPLVALMMLNAGGNAITVAAPLAALGTGPAAPALWRRHLGRAINLAHVFPGTSHHLAIREFIEASGLQIGRDVNLCVMPPAQTPSLLRSGIIDGYCAGEPWNTLATTSGVGTIIRAGTEIFPNHPEKALAVTRTWHEQNPHAAERLIQATLRGCDFCENPANHSRLSKLLAAPAYLGLDEDVIARSLSIDSWLRVGLGRPRFRSFARAPTVPHAASVEWIVRQMMRWDELPKTSDVEGIAAESVAIDTYIRATAEPKPTKRITQEQIA